MKSGETRFVVKKLDLKDEGYNSVAFRLSNGKTTIKKSTDAQDTKDKVLVQDGVFLIPLQQTDTQALEGNVTLEAQINYKNHSVRKSDDNFMYIGSTLGTDQVQGSQPAEDDGIEVVMTAIEEGVAVIVNPEASQELIDAVTELFQDTKQIAQSVRDDADAGEFDGYSPQVTVKTETPSTYVLHIKDADHEFDTPNLQGQGGEGTLEAGDGLKREDNTMSVDIDANSILEFNNHKLSADTSGLQPTISGGNGIDVSSDVVSVGLKSGETILGFDNGKLKTDLSAYYTKTEIDQMISADLKFEVVQTLPTEDIDTHTIYLVPKSTAQTNNVYDEYMYINNAWELIGSTEVDLSNYYTKTESDNKYQLIIDSSHKVSADNIDDNQSTNKFVRIIQSTDTPPTESSTRYEVGTIWQKYSSSVFHLQNLTNVYVCKGHTSFLTFPIHYEWEEITNHYTKSETDTLLNAKANTNDVYTKTETYSKTETDNKFTNATSGSCDVVSSALAQFIDISDYATFIATNNLAQEQQSGLVIKLYDSNDTQILETLLYDTTTHQPKLIDISSASKIKVCTYAPLTFSLDYQLTNEVVRERELTTKLSAKQDTIDTTHKLSSDLVDDTNHTNKFVPTHSSTESGKVLGVDTNGDLEWTTKGGGSSYSGGDGIDITNDTISVDIASGSALQITSGELDVDLSSKQDTIDSNNMLDADLVDDSNSTNKFVTSSEKSTWSGKEDKTTITTDTSSTTPSLTLADNNEYRYTQELTSLTLTMPSGDFIASVVFSSGSTPTSMTYDSSIKWSGDDITNGQFVPTEKTYNVVLWYDGINVNGVVRGV